MGRGTIEPFNCATPITSCAKDSVCLTLRAIAGTDQLRNGPPLNDAPDEKIPVTPNLLCLQREQPDDDLGWDTRRRRASRLKYCSRRGHSTASIHRSAPKGNSPCVARTLDNAMQRCSIFMSIGSIYTLSTSGVN